MDSITFVLGAVTGFFALAFAMSLGITFALIEPWRFRGKRNGELMVHYFIASFVLWVISVSLLTTAFVP